MLQIIRLKTNKTKAKHIYMMIKRNNLENAPNKSYFKL